MAVSTSYSTLFPGDPESDRLGKRLKGDFKKVAPAIKALTSKALYELQAKGEIVIEGHTLTTEDIKVSFSNSLRFMGTVHWLLFAGVATLRFYLASILDPQISPPFKVLYMYKHF